MDFIKQLPELNRFTNILVIVDHFMKQAIFIPMVKILDATSLAKLFV